MGGWDPDTSSWHIRPTLNKSVWRMAGEAPQRDGLNNGAWAQLEARRHLHHSLVGTQIVVKEWAGAPDERIAFNENPFVSRQHDR